MYPHDQQSEDHENARLNNFRFIIYFSKGSVCLYFWLCVSLVLCSLLLLQ